MKEIPNSLSPKQLQNFWSKVEKLATEGGCWIWTGCCGPFGHGMFGINQEMRFAHRISYTLHRGRIPDGDGYHGTCVLHRCDVPACINPEHLFLGTITDNNRDREAKGRGNKPTGDLSWSRLHPERVARGDRSGSRLHPESLKRGEENGNAKLTVSEVLKIRNLHSSGASRREIAMEFFITPQCVMQIITGKTWKHVQPSQSQT